MKEERTLETGDFPFFNQPDDFPVGLVARAICHYVVYHLGYPIRCDDDHLYSLRFVSPTFLLSPVAGVWADRFNRKMLIIGSDAMIAMATLVLAILLWDTMRYGCFLPSRLSAQSGPDSKLPPLARFCRKWFRRIN